MNDVLATKDIKEGQLSLRRAANGELVLRQISDTRHFADHRTFFLFDDQSKLIGTRPLSEQAAKVIMAKFGSHGGTEAFNITQLELDEGRPLDASLRDKSASITSVRHKRTVQERSYTAIGDKLDYHWPIFRKLKETGFGSIIRATMTLHQVCSSNCQFCSTIMRNRSDSISLEEAKDFVEALDSRQIQFNRENFPVYNDAYKAVTGKDIGLRGLILSGGGQPNLWPHFEEFVDWLSGLDIDLGLITNGFPKKIADAVYDKFTWIRLSITPAEASPFYPGGRFEDQYIPANLLHGSGPTMGMSYVYGPWSSEDMLVRLDTAARNMNFDYCRLLTDCNLTRSAQLQAHQNLSETLYGLGLVAEDGSPTSKVFHQLKYHGDPAEKDVTWPDGQCMLQSYNVFWDTTGHDENGDSHCYPCDSVTVLADEKTDGSIDASARRFNPEKWGTVKAKQVSKLFTQPLKPWFDPRDICQSCLFVKNNRHARSLTEQTTPAEAPKGLKHLNFP